MPVDLHQRLSEYSYGYGVTREVGMLLESVGLNAIPYLPNLIDEAGLGFDVGFERPGLPLLLQFKLGEALQRFVRSDPAQPKPILNSPFWRFRIDTAEVNGQYDLLLKADQGGAEVYYVAPRFSDWPAYVMAFERGEILEHSLILKPSEIDMAMTRQSMSDGLHRVVYDKVNVYVCSEPAQVQETSLLSFAERLKSIIISRKQPLGDALKVVHESLSKNRELRMPIPVEADSMPYMDDSKASITVKPSLMFSESAQNLSPHGISMERQRRLGLLRENTKSEAEALFAAIGTEAWATGSQLIALTLDD